MENPNVFTIGFAKNFIYLCKNKKHSLPLVKSVGQVGPGVVGPVSSHFLGDWNEEE